MDQLIEIENIINKNEKMILLDKLSILKNTSHIILIVLYLKLSIC